MLRYRLIHVAVVALLLVLAAGDAATAQVPPDAVDCVGPVEEAEPGTPDWQLRDARNMYCAEQRHQDKLTHPLNLSPPDELGADAYREPSRHDDVRFRYDRTTISGLEAEIYRPCAPGTCEDLPGGLSTFEPPYPPIPTGPATRVRTSGSCGTRASTRCRSRCARRPIWTGYPATCPATGTPSR